MKKLFKFLGMQFVDLWHHFTRRCKTNIPLTIITFIFGAFCLGSGIYFAIIGRSRDVSLCFCYFLVIPCFYVLEHYLKIECPTLFAAILYIFILTGFIGACYNVYTYIPSQDDISHAIFGLFFTLFGFAIMKCFIGEPDTKKKFFACLFFAIGFSYIMSIAWEFFEFAMDNINPMYDMQEDTIVDHIHSFFLHDPYDHLNTEVIDGIQKTVIYLKDGSTYVIEGGYLDIGIIDTMCDLIWCTVGTLGTCLVVALSWLLGKKKAIYNLLIPAYNGNAGKAKQEQIVNVDIADSIAQIDEDCEEPPEEAASGEEPLQQQLPEAHLQQETLQENPDLPHKKQQTHTKAKLADGKAKSSKRKVK